MSYSAGETKKELVYYPKEEMREDGEKNMTLERQPKDVDWKRCPLPRSQPCKLVKLFELLNAKVGGDFFPQCKTSKKN